MRHILNSAGIVRFPEAQFDMIRLGIGLYGVGASDEEQKKLAEEFFCKIFIVTVENHHGGKNHHHISDQQMRKMAEKYSVKLLP